ncbi:MAG: hypothetical protein JWR69_3831 [Pedosphaera sp.]|nr:hypothetical protein [Pedosphaera sp.]
MELFSPLEQNREVPTSSGDQTSIPQSTADRPIQPIAELITRPEFPQCAVGEQVDIGGYTGVVVEIVNQSIKVRSPEGAIRGFNVHALRKLYGPVQHPEAAPRLESRMESVIQPADELKDQPVDPSEESAPPTPSEDAPAPKVIITNPDFDQPLKPISDLLTDPDFPKSALGENVNIGGTTGVIVEIVRNSIKVRSAEGGTMSYNVRALHKLYGPYTPPEPIIVAPAPAFAPAAEVPVEPKPAVKRQVITDPNFEIPLKSIEEFLDRTDFPKCAFGEFIDLRGYTGIVVEIVNRSLKVRSREGSTRSYNADGLRKAFRR